MLHKPNEHTQKAFDELDKIIAEDHPKMFPYTTRELSERLGIGNSNIYQYLITKGLYAKGRRWFYRNIQEREHE